MVPLPLSGQRAGAGGGEHRGLGPRSKQEELQYLLATLHKQTCDIF